ncbi:Sec-independent protein translocase subunit TatA [Pseudokineococcus lusitanus]|uniref:Sec-independent protein translocase protein TatA n=1 Tax=Pseudokineococcus lusitanus TaxID=763993 RepID=A0A3N1HT04_9ACTN|nr:Sec-independent protein translocase subunit TatA [Pseudokineococcus lusitanus]ROP45522.1 sec-independent protein translocase protein TatA [Pseudokineococcus lusitanus]
MRPEPWHILILLIVIIVLFGAKRLPDITRNVGKSMRIFKTEVKSLRDEDTPASGSTGTTGTTGSAADEAPRASLEGSAVDEAREHERRRADEHHRPSA